MQFQKLTLNDLKAAVSLNNSINTTPSWFPADKQDEKLMIDSELNFGAFDNQKLVGKVGFILKANNEYEVTNMIIDTDYLHMGLGGKLFSYALEILIKKKHPSKIILHTYPKNTPAVALYRKFGFVQTDLIPNKYGPGFDRVRMEQVLSGE